MTIKSWIISINYLKILLIVKDNFHFLFLQILYTIIVMISALHFEVVSQTPGKQLKSINKSIDLIQYLSLGLMAFTVAMIFVSGFCVISSVFLIIGLCVVSKLSTQLIYDQHSNQITSSSSKSL